MANITTTGGSDYPNSIDTRTALTDGSSGDEIIAAHPNGLGSAVLAVETELGTLPKGSAADVKTRLGVATNDAGAVTLGTAASTVGVLPFNRGGVGLAFASTTNTADGYLLGFANAQIHPLTITSGSGIRAVATSGTWTIQLDSTAKISGDLVQMVFATVTGFTTTNGTKAVDNSPITTAHGSGFGLSLDFKATSVSNRVYARVSVMGCNDSTGMNWWGLFLGGSTSAVTGGGSGFSASNLNWMGGDWLVTTISASTISYAVRTGGTGGTFTLNGQAAGGLFNNSVTSSLCVWEVQN